VELALDIDPGDRADAARLVQHGWNLVDPAEVAADPVSYRCYIGESAGEIMVPKNIYARTGSGWFSDRSACYLAKGRPVVAGDTGLRDLYPVDAGLLPFDTTDEAVDHLDRLSNDYVHQADAARAVAEEYFDSDRVLADLLTGAGVG
jgi:hypothetical protein